MAAQDLIPSQWWNQLNDYAQAQVENLVDRRGLTPENSEFGPDEEDGLGFLLSRGGNYNMVVLVQDVEDADITLDPEGMAFPAGFFSAPANTIMEFWGNDPMLPVEALAEIVELQRQNPSQDEGYDASYEFLLAALQDSPVNSFNLQTFVPRLEAEQGEVVYRLERGSDEDGPHVEIVETWLAANLNDVIIQDADVVILGESSGLLTVQNPDGTAVLIGGGDQFVGGSSANDIFVSFGGGEKFLNGGGGNDIFAFAAHAHYTIADFNEGDKVAIARASSFEQLRARATGVEQDEEGVTVQFGPEASITFLGLAKSDLNADMLDLSFF